MLFMFLHLNQILTVEATLMFLRIFSFVELNSTLSVAALSSHIFLFLLMSNMLCDAYKIFGRKDTSTLSLSLSVYRSLECLPCSMEFSIANFDRPLTSWRNVMTRYIFLYADPSKRNTNLLSYNMRNAKT